MVVAIAVVSFSVHIYYPSRLLDAQPKTNFEQRWGAEEIWLVLENDNMYQWYKLIRIQRSHSKWNDSLAGVAIYRARGEKRCVKFIIFSFITTL